MNNLVGDDVDLSSKILLQNIHIPYFDKYFYKNKESKLDFRDRVAVLNDFLYI